MRYESKHHLSKKTEGMRRSKREENIKKRGNLITEFPDIYSILLADNIVSLPRATFLYLCISKFSKK